MGDDLKLFGEVGLGYSQLAKDAEAINKIFNELNSEANKLSKELKKNNITLNTGGSEQEFRKQKEELERLIEENKRAEKAIISLTENFKKLAKETGKTQKTVEQTTKTLNNLDFGSKAIKEKVQDVSSELEKQEKELIAWANTNKKVSKEMDLLSASNMAIDEHKRARKTGNTSKEANDLNRLVNIMNILNSKTIDLRETIARLSVEYENAKKVAKGFVTESEKVNKIVSRESFDKDVKRGFESELKNNYQQTTYKNGEIKHQIKYLTAQGVEVKKVYKEAVDGVIRLEQVSKRTNVAKPIKESMDEAKKSLRDYERMSEKIGKQINVGLDDDKKGLLHRSKENIGVLMAKFYAMKRLMSAFVAEVAQFEQRAIEIQRIANYTNDEMKSLNKQTFEIAKNFGLGVEKVQEIEALWARAGKTGQELVDASRTTALGFNVAEFKEAETAVASLNSIINQMYEGDATKSPEILDAITKVADKTAVRNVEDLVEVVSRSGAMAKELGMDLHGLNATASLVMERMKVTGESLGTHLRSIFTFMSSEASIRKMEKYGVNLTKIGADGTESLKTYEEMMETLIKKYNELGGSAKANFMLQDLVGKRNVVYFKNIMAGWEQYQERVNLSKGSKGFAERQNEKMMESYAKQVEQLKTQTQELVVALGNAGFLDLMKLGVKGGKAFTDMLLKMGTAGKALVQVFGALAAAKVSGKLLGKMFDLPSLRGVAEYIEYAKGINNAKNNLAGVGDALSTGDALKKVATETTNMTLMTERGKARVEALMGSFTKLKTAIAGANASTIAFSGAIGLVIAGVVALGVHMYRNEQRRKTILDNFSTGKAQEAKENIDSVKKAYDSLVNSDAFKKGDPKALEDYKSITSELSEALGVYDNVIVGNKESMDSYNKSLEIAYALEKSRYELEQKQAKLYAEEEMKKQLPAYDAKPKYADLRGEGRVSSSDSEIKNTTRDLNFAADEAKKLEQEIDKISKTADMSDEKTVRMLDRKRTKLNEYQKQANQYRQDLTAEFQSLIQMKELTNMSDEDFSKMLESSGIEINGTKLVDLFKDLSGGDIDKFKEKLGIVEEQADDASEAIRGLNEVLDEFKSATSIQEGIDKALDEQLESGTISDGTVANLLGLDENISTMLIKTAEGWKLTGDAIAYAKEQGDLASSSLEQAVEEAKRQVTEGEDGLNLENYATDFDSFMGQIDTSINTLFESNTRVIDSFTATGMSADELFGKLENVKNIDQIDIKLNADELNSLNMEIFSRLKTGMTDLKTQFENGSIGVTEYADKLTTLQNKYLDLYTKTNSLTFDKDSKQWKDSAGNVDAFATSLERSAQKTTDLNKTIKPLMEKLAETPEVMQKLADSGNFEGVISNFEEIGEVANQVFSDLAENSPEVWNDLCSQVAEATGYTKEQVADALTGVSDDAQAIQDITNVAFQTLFGQLSSSLGTTGEAIVKAVNWALTQVNKVISAYNVAAKFFGSNLLKPFGKMSMDGLSFGNPKGFNITGRGGSDKPATDEQIKKYKDSDGNKPSKPTRRGGGGGGGRKSSKSEKKDIPDHVQKLIDEVEDSLKYEEIDDYEYSKKLENILKQYKSSLTKKGVKELEKKIRESSVKGVDKKFEADISDLEKILKLADLSIKKLEAEQSVYEALNLDSSMDFQTEKIEAVTNKIVASENVSKKYKLALKLIEEEMKKLDKTSVAYKDTMEALIKKQDEYIQKLNESKTSIIELERQRIQEQVALYDKRQENYDKSVQVIEDLESRLVSFVNSRNQEIRKEYDKTHQARLDQIEEEIKAKDEQLEKEKKRLRDALDAYTKYMQKKMQLLDEEYSEEDYNEELDKKVKERDELQSRINSLSLDDTSIAKGKRIELAKQLADKDNEIEKFQRNRSRELTKNELQKQLDDYTDHLNNKLKALDDETENMRKENDFRRKMMEDEHQRELELLDEKMKASSVYAEVKQAILSGYVQDATGASITIRDAMIRSMEEQGQASGILRAKHIANIDAVIAKMREAQQVLGMLNNSAGQGSLQQRLGLTDQGYRQYLAQKADDLGFSDAGTAEQYIMNKLAWESATSDAERKKYAEANHLIRKQQVDRFGGDYNNKEHNRDINGLVYGKSWIFDTGNASRQGQQGGQFTPIPGWNDRDEARNLFQADLARNNPRTSNLGTEMYNNMLMSNPYSYGRNSSPNMSSYMGQSYYDRYKQQMKQIQDARSNPISNEDYAITNDYIQKLINQATQEIYNQAGGGKGQAIVDIAMAQKGKPYTWGSYGGGEFDCSGLAVYAYKQAGYNVDRFTSATLSANPAAYGFYEIPMNQIRAGDVLWKSGHIGIATSPDGSTIEANGKKKETHGSRGGQVKAHGAGRSGIFSKAYRYKGFSQGGIADFTGVAMLHGSKSAPEYIFNTPQFDALSKSIAGYVSLSGNLAQQLQAPKNVNPVLKINNLINIEGNADEQTVIDLESQSNKILDSLVNELKKSGIRS